MVFGCCGAPSTVPQGPVSSWTHADVAQWAEVNKLGAQKSAFTALTGKDVLALDLTDLETRFKGKGVPRNVQDAVNGLRDKAGLGPVQKMAVPRASSSAGVAVVQAIPAPQPAPIAPMGSPFASAAFAELAESASVTPSETLVPAVQSAAVEPEVVTEPAVPASAEEVAPAVELSVEQAVEEEIVEAPAAPVEEMTQLEITDRVTIDSVGAPERTTEESVVDPLPALPAAAAAPAVAHVVAVPATIPESFFVPFKETTTLADWSRTLHTFLPDEPIEAVAHFLECLGKGVGGGISEAVSVQPTVGDLFRSAYELQSTADRAGVARDNCLKAGALACDTLRILDITWRRMHSAGQTGPQTARFNEEALTQVTEGLRALTATATPFTRAGWLIEMCCNERIKEKFDNAHNAVVDGLKLDGLSVLPGGKPLPRGDYRDVSKVVRRLVRQHGSGNITAGLMNLKAGGVKCEGIKELSALLDLEAVYGCPLIMTELDALPTDSGIDVEVYYNQLLMGDNAGRAHHAVFEWYDREHKTGYIDMPRFQGLLKDLGLLEGKSEAEAQSYVAASFRTADARGQGRLGRDEFCAYYSTLTTSRARQQLRARMGLAAEEELRGVFIAFASFGSRTEVTDIDSARFYKLTKDCGITSANLTSIDVDLIFTKSKPKGARRMSFDQFLEALSMLADKKGQTLEALVRKILLTGGPIAHATKPEPTRLHDDKSTYTGVYSKGGPKAVDPVRNDLAALLDRSEADVRGVKKSTPPPKATPPVKTAAMSARKPPMSHQLSPPPAEFMRTSLGPGSITAASFRTGSSPVAVSVRRQTGSSAGPADLREMFNAFASFGNPHAAASPGQGGKSIEMDSSKFLKLCRECKLIDVGGKAGEGLTATRCDLIFAKVKSQGHTKITFSEFERALQLIAEVKGANEDSVVFTICNSDGPLLTRMVAA